MEPRQNCRNAPKPLMAFRSSCSIFGNYGGARKASNLVAELHPQGEASSSDDRSANNRETRGSRGFRAGSCRRILSLSLLPLLFLFLHLSVSLFLSPVSRYFSLGRSFLSSIVSSDDPRNYRRRYANVSSFRVFFSSRKDFFRRFVFAQIVLP